MALVRIGQQECGAGVEGHGKPPVVERLRRTGGGGGIEVRVVAGVEFGVVVGRGSRYAKKRCICWYASLGCCGSHKAGWWQVDLTKHGS